MTKDLFSEFPPGDKNAWMAQATRDMKGDDIARVLTRRLWDTIKLQPIYNREDWAQLPELPQMTFGDHLPEGGQSARSWVNYVAVYPSHTNEQILNLLEMGASGLILHLHGDESLDEMLRGVDAKYISILLKPMGEPLAVLRCFLGWVERSGLEHDSLSGGFLWSPTDFLFEGNTDWNEAMNTLREVMELSGDWKKFHAFALDFSRYHESGATALDELVFGFGELIELAAHASLGPDAIFSKCILYASAGENHFPEIAKLKAIRYFASELAWQYGFDLGPDDFYIVARTSGWSKSALDPYTNLIRQTYEAMAGGIGGVDGLWVAPFQQSGERENRIARNVSEILVHESYLDKVLDPAAGSYFIDSLVNQIKEEVQRGIGEMEESGGWLDWFSSRKIHRRVRQSRDSHQQAVLSGAISKIGANKYPSSETQSLSNLDIIEEKEYELKPYRASYLVELEKQKSNASGL